MASQGTTLPVDETARALAQTLLAKVRSAALAVIDPVTGEPLVSRIGFSLLQDQSPVTLISELSQHTQALAHNPHCSLLIGEPGQKGDPLTHPRLTIQATAERSDKKTHRDAYLTSYPKAKLYYDFQDFHLYVFRVQRAFLNGGFGKAYKLTSQDLGL